MMFKTVLVFTALIQRVICTCRLELCTPPSTCKCDKGMRKLTCPDARFAQRAFHCNFIEYHISSEFIVEVPWKSLSLENVNTTHNLTVDLSKARLNCSSCENAWILQWQTIAERTIRGVEQCLNCPSMSVYAWLKLPNLELGNKTTNGTYCSNKKVQELLEKCSISNPLEETSDPLRIVDLFDNESNEVMKCTSVSRKKNSSSAGCVSAIFRPIPLPGISSTTEDHTIIPTRFGDESRMCVTEMTLLENSDLNVTHSGFFGCSIKDGYIPAVEWRFVLFKGTPHFLEWKVRKDKDVHVDAEVISAADFKIYLLYSPNNIIVHPVAEEIMFEIQPSTDSEVKKKVKFEMTDKEEPFTNNFNKMAISGIQRQKVSLVFREFKMTCEFYGVYYLLAKSDHGSNVRRFDILDMPFGCKTPEEKFHVIKTMNVFLENNNDSISDNQSLKLHQTLEGKMFGHGYFGGDNTKQQTSLPPLPVEEQSIGGILVFIVNIILVAIGIAMCVGVKKVLDQRTKQLAAQVASSQQMDLLNPLLIQNPSYFDWMLSVQTRSDINVIPSDDLEIVREIGQGAFGQVHLVRRMQPSMVLSTENDHFLAMKQLKYVSPEKLADLEQEARVLTKLSHPNIVRFHGITLIDGAFGLLFEYMSEGDLVTYLRDRSQGLQDKEPVSYSDMLRMSIQVASGLEYLHGHHLVHRDVAARNCLVAAELVVKLSDFGMTRDVYVTDYYKMDSHTLVPLRWLPPESIVYRKFTIESDMWSYGVLLWEIFSGGQVPWYMYSNTEVLEIVKDGELLTKPDFCPEAVYKTLMLQCWAIKPNERITASKIKEQLTELLDTTSVYCPLTMDRSGSLQQEYHNLMVKSNSHVSA